MPSLIYAPVNLSCALQSAQAQSADHTGFTGLRTPGAGDEHLRTAYRATSIHSKAEALQFHL